MSYISPRRLRAPQDDGAALIDPPLDQFAALVRSNRQLAANWQSAILDQPLLGFLQSARTEFLQAAVTYTGQERDTSWLPRAMEHAPLVIAGHQPELFHPGVWFKNFLLSSAAPRLRGIGINLIVDTDLVRSTSIRVPVRTGTDAVIEEVAFDSSGDVVPFEERTIRDPWLFESFCQRVLAAYESCCAGGDELQQPILAELWKRAVDTTRRGKEAASLVLVLAQTRHWLEWRLGLQTLEIPLSRVAQTNHFRHFAIHLVTNLPAFQRIYNACLAEYRQANHIRSSTHPVPPLQESHDWVETPFFVWTSKDPQRRPLFLRRQAKSIVLSDRHGLELSLDVAADRISDTAIEQLAAAEARGIKLRPRALITTMYARLILSDLFIHGIGGAKYDELTDLIIRRFFGIEPPAYVTATATFRLPIDRPNVSLEDVRASVQRIRDLRYRPESFLRDPLVRDDPHLAPKLTALAAEKRAFLDQHDLRRCSQQIFDQLDSLNRAMHDLLKPIEEQMRAQHSDLIAQAKQAQVLASREFSFVLFPSENLPARLLALTGASS
jgi:hypothetical protein